MKTTFFKVKKFKKLKPLLCGVKLISKRALDSGGEEQVYEDDQGVIVVEFHWNKTIVKCLEK